MNPKLEIHHLKLLDALYVYKNISHAAESMNISQQAVSSKLKTIRELLGDQIFAREGHGMVPTPYAKSIKPYIENILEKINQFPLPENITLSTASRVIVISATDYAQLVIVKNLVIALRKIAPNLRVIVCNVEVASLTKKMNQGEIDLVFTSSGYIPKGLITEPLFTEQYLCVASEHSEIPSTLSFSELMQQNFIVTNPGTPSLTGSADAWLQKQGVIRSTAVSVPTFLIALEFIKSSSMVGFIPSRLLPYNGLREIKVPKNPPGYEVVAAYHPRVKHDQLIQWLLEQAKLIN